MSDAIKFRKEDSSGLFIPAGLFLGFALGFIFNNIPAGIFGGLGMGFLLFALFKNFQINKNDTQHSNPPQIKQQSSIIT